MVPGEFEMASKGNKVDLANILSDKHLSMRHNTINESLVVYGNDSLWSNEGREEIINRAVELYLESKRHQSLVSARPAKT